MHKSIAMLVGVAAAFAIASAPASAGAPNVIERNNVVERHFDIDWCEFPVVADLTLRRTVVEYYDSDGELARWVLRLSFAGTFTNVETGKTLLNSGRRMITDRVADQTSVEIASRRTHAPGAIGVDAGRLVYDWNGTPDNFDDDVVAMASGNPETDEDHAAVCAALAS